MEWIEGGMFSVLDSGYYYFVSVSDNFKMFCCEQKRNDGTGYRLSNIIFDIEVPTDYYGFWLGPFEKRLEVAPEFPMVLKAKYLIREI